MICYGGCSYVCVCVCVFVCVCIIPVVYYMTVSVQKNIVLWN